MSTIRQLDKSYYTPVPLPVGALQDGGLVGVGVGAGVGAGVGSAVYNCDCGTNVYRFKLVKRI